MRTFVLLACSVCLTASAQNVSRHEAAIGISLTTDHPYGSIPEVARSYTSFNFLSPVVRYDLNLNRHVSLEAEASRSTNHVVLNMREGGQQVVVLGGIKAGLRKGRWGFFGTAEAGAVSFSRAETMPSATSQGLVYNRVTHFGFRQGGAVEYSISSRNFLRLDVAELLDAQFKKTFYSSPYITVDTFSAVPNHLNAALSVGHRFGGLLKDEFSASARPTTGYSAGGFFALAIREHLLLQDTHALGGGGAWVEVPAWKALSLDLLAMDHPENDHTTNVQDGGSTFQAFAGPKIGFHAGPIGLYAKGRPGIVRFSRTNTLVERTISGNTLFPHHQKNDFGLDTGLVLQYSPATHAWRHLVTRIEAGSVLTSYPKTTVTVRDPSQSPSTMAYTTAAVRHSGFMALSGVGFSW